MITQINQNQATYFDHFKYYASNFIDSAKNSLLSIYPIAPLGLIGDLFLAVEHLFPPYYFSNPDYEDPEYEEYILSGKQDQARFVELYENFGIKVLGNKYFEKDCKDMITHRVDSAISEVMEIIEEFNQELNMSIQLCVGISTSDSYSPYSATGGALTTPIIKMRFPKIEILIPEAENNEKVKLNLNVGTLDYDQRKFIIAHEISHLKNNDSIKGTAWNITTSAISCLPWLVNYSTSSSWSSYIAISSVESWAINTISKFGYSFFARRFEEKADREALNLLGQNKGAVEFFSGIDNQIDSKAIDFLHPSHETRLQYCQDWKPEKQTA